MKKTKIFISLCSVSLVIGGFLSTKANKKYAGVTSGVIVAGATVAAHVTSLSAGFTTMSNGHVVVLVRADTKQVIGTLYTSTNMNHKIYYTL